MLRYRVWQNFTVNGRPVWKGGPADDVFLYWCRSSRTWRFAPETGITVRNIERGECEAFAWGTGSTNPFLSEWHEWQETRWAKASGVFTECVNATID